MGKTADRFVRRLLAASLLCLSGASGICADEFHTPSISAMRVEWRAVLDQLRAEIGTAPSAASTLTFASQRRVPAYDPRATPALVQLNALTGTVFNGIGRSSIPVLLPFDVAGWLEDRQNGAADGAPPWSYQRSFRTDLFHAGASGYDAVFSLEPGDGAGLPPRAFARPVEVQISGSLLVYDLADPTGGKGEPVKSLAAQFPDMRRFIREGYVRYAFTRFGVPYVVSIQCLDSAPRARRLACREAYPIAERFLKALRVAGGQPSRPRTDIASVIAERPATPSPDFTYRASGDIIARTGLRNRGGHADLTAYSQIRFPLVRTPVAVRSQQFARRDRTSLVAGAYPWRDNFCEARSFNVGQCASGFGHQGQDIRPVACAAGSDTDEACDLRRQPVVAVRDGVVIRSLRQQAATLQINTRTEHIRFRYMHMNPSAMDADGVLNGRRVSEGEPIGVVSNYLDRPGGTSRHLHFDIQVFTRDGWLWVNPYTTLIAAYERLIRGRGRELGTEPVTASAVAHALPEDVLRRDAREGGEN
ncbi:M23 family metallopeptidase [Bradyrhizobium lablabi]|uniref:M23 family metallopeptidase n=1 Tax=Bradyrhizobium lablabi TaxID=722472 RepID=UPI001BA75876|nr:M23 family metallopeptidase [Bradyrhizobium lablabi]MBR1122624.1 M23 family metallopeptidase [Bradyrhizobium lablabi]